MIDVQRGSLRALQQHPPARRKRARDLLAHVGRHRGYARGHRHRLLHGARQRRVGPQLAQPVPRPRDPPLHARRTPPAVEQIGHPHPATTRLGLVRGPDALPRGSDLAVGRRLRRPVERLVIREHDVRARAHTDAPQRLQPALDQFVDLPEELREIDHDAVAEEAALVAVEDPGRHLVQDEMLVPGVHGVARVRAPLVARDHVDVGRQHVHDLALPLVAPLATDDDGAGSAQRAGVQSPLVRREPPLGSAGGPPSPAHPRPRRAGPRGAGAAADAGFRRDSRAGRART